MRFLRAALVATLLAGCGEEATSPSTEEQVTPALATAAGALAFREIHGGSTHTCGVTTTNQAYCWGSNDFGQLGTGGFGADATTRPVAAAGSLRFLAVRVGAGFTCGLTTDNRIFCWGLNTEGQLGNGSNSQNSLVPVPLAGDRRYRLLRLGPDHGCAISLSEVTFCWGFNRYGQLGDGTTATRRSPVKVAGRTTYKVVSPGQHHTCGLTWEKKAYCWGLNMHGQLGNLSSVNRLTPGPVADGLSFKVISAGQAHTCGVTTEKKAYCWGWNENGTLGDGSTRRRSRPTLVAGGRTFAGISAGGAHTCAVTTAKVAYCWGWNFYGQVGDGTSAFTSTLATKRLTPVRVSGGLLFVSVVAANNRSYSCGVTIDNRGYCWGENVTGLLGNGSTSHRGEPVPTAVAPPT